LIRVLIAALFVLAVTNDRAPVTGFFDLPVTGGTATFEMLGLRPEERGHALPLLVREMFMQSSGAVERTSVVRAAPAAFWVSARSIKIEKDRVVVPGGAVLEPLWESMAAGRVMRPADFLRALLTKNSGRLAWFYDAGAAMPATRLTALAKFSQIDRWRTSVPRPPGVSR